MRDKKVLGSLRVLYLEDEPLISLDTADCLRELGFLEVVAVGRLKAAEDAYASQTFHLAILDINVDQGQTSLQFGKAAQQAGIPVIFASGNGADADILRKRGYRFLSKPFSPAQLEDEVLKALASDISRPVQDRRHPQRHLQASPPQSAS